MNECPMCGENDCEISYNSMSKYGNRHPKYIECKNYNIRCAIHDSGSKNAISPVQFKYYNAIFAFLLKTRDLQSTDDRAFEFYYDASDVSGVTNDDHYINVFQLLFDYPMNNFERIEKTLMNLSMLFPKVGDQIFPGDETLLRALYCESSFGDTANWTEISNTLQLLQEVGYLSLSDKSSYFTISADGWKKLSELSLKELNQGFIAMDFKTDKIVADKIIEAIQDCGYSKMIMNRHEHSKQIVPELLYQIRQSAFMIADVSTSNCNVYYEAGFAEALGKEVIVCCEETDAEEDASKKLKFDIAQKSTIFYKNHEDLYKRICRRIAATVGAKKELPADLFDDA